MNDTEGITVVLGRVRENGPQIEGASMVVAGCGHYAWMSQNAVQLLTRNPDGRTKCDGCLSPQELFGTEVNAVPGAIEEAAQHLHTTPEDVAATLSALARQHGGSLAPYAKDMK